MPSLDPGRPAASPVLAIPHPDAASDIHTASPLDATSDTDAASATDATSDIDAISDIDTSEPPHHREAHHVEAQ